MAIHGICIFIGKVVYGNALTEMFGWMLQPEQKSLELMNNFVQNFFKVGYLVLPVFVVTFSKPKESILPIM